MQHSLNNNADNQLGRNGSIVIMDALNETAPFVLRQPTLLETEGGQQVHLDVVSIRIHLLV